jgi:hypothetical protein
MTPHEFKLKICAECKARYRCLVCEKLEALLNGKEIKET